jgi:hypothetical protein
VIASAIEHPATIETCRFLERRPAGRVAPRVGAGLFAKRNLFVDWTETRPSRP